MVAVHSATLCPSRRHLKQRFCCAKVSLRFSIVPSVHLKEGWVLLSQNIHSFGPGVGVRERDLLDPTALILKSLCLGRVARLSSSECFMRTSCWRAPRTCSSLGCTLHPQSLCHRDVILSGKDAIKVSVISSS